MDILHLIDRLEALVAHGWHIPLTSDVIVKEEEFLHLLDEMRARIPQEVQQAKRVLQERERLLAQTREERERLLALAGEEAARRTEEHDVVKSAQARADTIIDRAKKESLAVRQGADEYAMDVLTNLQKQLETFMNTVNNWILMIRQGPPPEPPDDAGQS
jgi:cell division septum initiation protein DivIVA